MPEESAGELVWVRRFLAGDQEAFWKIAERYQDRIYRVALSACGTQDLAADVTQETFVRAYGALRRWKEGSLGAWLCGIAVNVAREYRRKFRALRRLAEIPEQSATPIEESAADPEALRVVAEEVAALPERQHEVILLRFYAGLAYEEIARTLGCPEGTVKSNLYKAIQNLSSRLGTRLREPHV